MVQAAFNWPRVVLRNACHGLPSPPMGRPSASHLPPTCLPLASHGIIKGPAERVVCSKDAVDISRGFLEMVKDALPSSKGPHDGRVSATAFKDDLACPRGFAALVYRSSRILVMVSDVSGCFSGFSAIPGPFSGMF